MKKFTKETVRLLELHKMRWWLEGTSLGKFPLVFFGDLPSGIDGGDAHTIQAGEQGEEKIRFVLVPNVYSFGRNEKNLFQPIERDFREGYVNHMRVISELPEEILNCMKDRRLLALGYATEAEKEKIFNYLDGLPNPEAHREAWEQSEEEVAWAIRDLSIAQKEGYDALDFRGIFGEGHILDRRFSGRDICFELEYPHGRESLILTDAEVTEEELCPQEGEVMEFEIYRDGEAHELHLLLLKQDENLADRFYYATYRFRDMK